MKRKLLEPLLGFIFDHLTQDEHYEVITIDNDGTPDFKKETLTIVIDHPEKTVTIVRECLSKQDYSEGKRAKVLAEKNKSEQ